MKNKLFSIVGMIMLTIVSLNAQKIIEGDKKLSFLAGETSFNIQYIYDGMMVGKMTETEYREKKVSEMNAKQNGKGTKWEKNWVDARQTKYEVMFEELLNKNLMKGGASASKENKEAKYTIVVKTVVTEPGYNVVVSKMNPYVTFEISWIEIATGKVMAVGEMKKVPGVLLNGEYDFDPSNGIKESYAKAGKTIGKSMTKAIKAKKK